MNTTLILLVYVVLPVLIIIAAFSKIIQEPVNKPRRVKMSTREHRELFEAAFIAPMRIKPFPPDTHHEQEITEQSEKMDSDRTSGE